MCYASGDMGWNTRDKVKEVVAVSPPAPEEPKLDVRCNSRSEAAACYWLLHGGTQVEAGKQYGVTRDSVRHTVYRIVRERKLADVSSTSEEGIAAFGPLRDKAESVMNVILDRIEAGQFADSTIGSLVHALGSFTKAMEGSADRLQDSLKHDGPIAYPTSFYKAQIILRYLGTIQEMTPEKADKLAELITQYYNEAKNEKRGKYRVWIRKMQLPPDAELPKPFEGGVKMPETMVRVDVPRTQPA